MKKLSLILLCIVLLSGCAATYDGPTETEYVLTESVKTYYGFDGEAYDQIRTVSTYDLYGNQVQTEEYRDGEELLKHVSSYDDRGNRTKKVSYVHNGWFYKRATVTEYAYDEQNRMIAKVHDSGEGPIEYRYIYDDAENTRTTTCQGVVTSVERFDENGFLLSQKHMDEAGWELKEYTRRSDGQPLTEHITNSTGLDVTNLFEYDDHGQQIRMVQEENGIQTETYHYRYEYDDQGRILRLLEAAGEQWIEQSRREYDDVQNSMTFYMGGERSHTIVYDDAGREVEQRFYRDDGSMGIHETFRYQPIQVPAKEETP